MIQIGKTLISEEIFSEEFVCNLSKCKGICCVEGDSGAPLVQNELQILENIYTNVKPFLSNEGIKAIEAQGKYVIDDDGDFVTPLINDGACAYVIFEKNGTTKCGIEKAHEKGAIAFKKPISCHLYPIRVTEYTEITAVNYHKWTVCSDACVLGKELQIPVVNFLKEPLIRKFGINWYNELNKHFDYYKNTK